MSSLNIVRNVAVRKVYFADMNLGDWGLGVYLETEYLFLREEGRVSRFTMDGRWVSYDTLSGGAYTLREILPAGTKLEFTL